MSKKPKSGKGERRKAIKPVLAWAAHHENGSINPNSVHRCSGGASHYLRWSMADSGAVARVLIVDPRFYRIVPRNPKRKAK